jgi:hypothetical protein
VKPINGSRPVGKQKKNKNDIEEEEDTYFGGKAKKPAPKPSS